MLLQTAKHITVFKHYIIRLDLNIKMPTKTDK